MSRGRAADLARVKVAHPAWTIRRIDGQRGEPDSFTASRDSNGDEIKAGTLADLERQLVSRNGGELP